MSEDTGYVVRELEAGGLIFRLTATGSYLMLDTLQPGQWPLRQVSCRVGSEPEWVIAAASNHLLDTEYVAVRNDLLSALKADLQA